MLTKDDRPIIDISPRLSSATAVWPGDIPLRRQVQLCLQDGHNIELSSLNSTVHLGAHADAPSHYCTNGASIEQVPLLPYLGPCRVVTIRDQKLITGEHLARALANIDDQNLSPRILIRTETFPNHELFREDFAALTAHAITYLASRGVLLVGIDTPSIDPFDSKDLPTHHALVAHGLYNLEGLDLSAAEDGAYELIALPLKLVGFDASPLRAVLRPFR